MESMKSIQISPFDLHINHLRGNLFTRLFAAPKGKVPPKQQPATKPPVQNTAQAKRAKDAKPPMSLVMKLCIVLAIVSCLVNGNTFQNGYVLDDVMVIKENHYVQMGLSGVVELLKTPHLRGHINLATDTYRPLSLVMFAIEYEFFGLNPAAGHFFNILFFAACVVMLFVFLYHLLDEKRIVVAFIAALIFAVHPIHTEVVANIKSRDELLCFFFAFMSLNIYVSYMKTGKIQQLIIGAFVFFLAMISKETVVTFLGVVPIVFFFYKNENRTRAVFITAATLAVIVAFLLIRSSILNEYNSNAPYDVKFIDNLLVKAPNAASKFATEILILGKYLSLCIVPYPLLCNYAFNSIPYVTFANVWVLLSLVVYLALIGLSIFRLFTVKKDPWAFGILFFLATISLFSNIPFLVGSALAIRFAFFASAGVCLLMALAIEKWVLKMQTDDLTVLNTNMAKAVLVPIVLIYSVMTFARNADWKDNYTLYSTDVLKSPIDTWLLYFMGAELQKKYGEETDPTKQQKILNDCIGYLNRSLAVYQYNTASHAELGAAYFRAKVRDSAIFHLNRALELNPNQSNAAANLGTLYLGENKYDTALIYYRRTIAANPGNVIALFNEAVCFVQVKKLDSAVYTFKRSVELAPDYENHKGFQYTAMVYQMMGKMDSARKYELLMQKFNPAFKL